jgi:hypothetical protein
MIQFDKKWEAKKKIGNFGLKDGHEIDRLEDQLSLSQLIKGSKFIYTKNDYQRKVKGFINKFVKSKLGMKQDKRPVEGFKKMVIKMGRKDLLKDEQEVLDDQQKLIKNIGEGYINRDDLNES